MSQADQPTTGELPLDCDVEVDESESGPARPPHLRWSFLGLVLVGGAVGTAIREALVLTWPAPTGGFPFTVFGINVVGAFVLGALLEFVSRRGRDVGRRRTIRLLVGTGILGGFTTYSAFAVDTASLTGSTLGVAFLYAAVTVVVGFLASAAGVAVATPSSARSSREEEAA